MKIYPLMLQCVLVLSMSMQVWAQSIEELMNTGQVMLQRGAYSQAVTAFRQAVTKERDNFEAQANLGFAYLGWGRYSNAVEELKKALGLNSRNAEVWSNLAIAYENLGRTEDAAGALNQAVSLDPTNVVARMNLATIYANGNQPAKAISMYKQVIEMDGTNEEALLNISQCYIALGQITEAKQFLKQTSMANPSNGQAHWELGNILWKKEQNKDEAIKEYRLAINAQPSNINLYENLAMVLVEKGEKVDAIEVLRQSMKQTDEVLHKDKIQAQIDRIEGKTSANDAGPSGGTKLTMKDQSGDLKKELRQEEPRKEVKTYDAKPVDVMGDLNDLDKSEAPALDLKSEAKKRATK